MSKSIIEVTNLSKKYRLGQRRRNDTLRDELAGLTRYTLGILRKNGENRLESGEFWALKDINFNVNQGEVLGIIGKNGSGKSTLLKILSRITAPTSGQAHIRGRVASLLEVGTGFSPELTGRENIFLNGAILGMTQKEIKRKFDEIVDFSEIEKFIDTPVKHYSSGMYVRLAFAVAAHLEPDILIIDEVLAVGDTQFQKKSMKKIREISNNLGRTVLLVSHNLSLIQSMARETLYLENGMTPGLMNTGEAIIKYLGPCGEQTSAGSSFTATGGDTPNSPYIESAFLSDDQKQQTNKFKSYEDINISINWVNNVGVDVTPNIMLVNGNGVTALVATDAPVDFDGSRKRSKGSYTSRVKIPKNLLNVGEYMINIALDSFSPRVCYDSRIGVLSFSVWDPMNNRSVARGISKELREDAILWPVLDWSYKKNK